MSNVERRDRIVRILRMNGTVTAEYLANRLSVSSRTILRDIVELSIRYPITTQTGRHGGITMLNTAALPRTILPESEIMLLKKIFGQIETQKKTVLSPEELQLLEEMISTYEK